MQISDMINKVSNVVASGFTSTEEERKRYFGNGRRALTFDLFGCLINHRMITHFVGQIGRENNINPELTERYFQLYLDRVKYAMDFMTYTDVLNQTMAWLDMTFNTKVFSQASGELLLVYGDMRPHPDVVPSLQKLKNSGYELYLIANANIQMVQKQFDNLGGFFSEKNIILADEVRCYKPNPNFFKAAAEKFKLRTADHFHVSSSYFQDILPATRMRWLTAYINRSQTGVLAGYEPSVVLSTLNDLEEGLIYARRRIEEEEKAAREREAQAKAQAAQAQANEAAAAKAKAEQEARARQQKAIQQQQAQQQQMQQQMAARQGQMSPAQMQQARAMGSFMDINDDMVEFGGVAPDTNQYFVPQNEKDFELAEKMKHMPPAKARALAKARERAMQAARARGN